MSTKRVLWRLYLPFMLILLLSLAVVLWYSSQSLYKFCRMQSSSDLEARARLTAHRVGGLLALPAINEINPLCRELGRETATRITVILPDGKVIGDTDEDPQAMENHATRPEIAEALAGKIGMSTRYSNTLQKNLMYVAVPVHDGNNIIAVVRTSFPVSSVDEAISGIRLRIVFGGLIVAVLGALFSLIVSRKISRPLEELKEGAQRFAGGELDFRLPVHDTEEIRELSEAMNQMAVQLEDRIRTIVKQRNEQEAMFASMTEGILAIDTEERIININQTAAKLFGINQDEAAGKSIQEAVRNPALQELVSTTLKSTNPVEEEITVTENGERVLQAHGSVLQDESGERMGALIVLNDMTKLKRLENVRREFVANVSHELKTPITSIKGFVETLKDGAVNDPPQARRFLDIIARQSDRLNAIIEDILSLSRIEQEAEKRRIEVKEGKLKKVIEAAIQSCEHRASEKSMRVELSCPEELSARISAPLLEQAIVNLLDNAIKFSDEKASVTVRCYWRDNEILIAVQDQGCGIGKEHLPRLFERFYRVDRARSSTLGGTGLGLAIVKHIALAHNGKVSVESSLGEGSTFNIHLPIPVDN
jgi:two-component system phosphate regulon sensor histidine kinase PhoR